LKIRYIQAHREKIWWAMRVSNPRPLPCEVTPYRKDSLPALTHHSKKQVSHK
jgi:hypothetical protein